MEAVDGNQAEAAADGSLEAVVVDGNPAEVADGLPAAVVVDGHRVAVEADGKSAVAAVAEDGNPAEVEDGLRAAEAVDGKAEEVAVAVGGNQPETGNPNPRKMSDIFFNLHGTNTKKKIKLLKMCVNNNHL